MATRNATKADTKPKTPRGSSRRPGPGVQSTLGVTRPARRRRKEIRWSHNNSMSASTCTGGAA